MALTTFPFRAFFWFGGGKRLSVRCPVEELWTFSLFLGGGFMSALAAFPWRRPRCVAGIPWMVFSSAGLVLFFFCLFFFFLFFSFFGFFLLRFFFSGSRFRSRIRIPFLLLCRLRSPSVWIWVRVNTGSFWIRLPVRLHIGSLFPPPAVSMSERPPTTTHWPSKLRQVPRPQLPSSESTAGSP